MTLIKRLVAVALMLVTEVLSAGPLAENLNFAAVADASRISGQPILMVFGAESCGYCERLNSEILSPMLESGELQKQALVRAIDIHQGGRVEDFDGSSVRSRVFLRRYDVYATPTVMLLDASGEPLAQPIVGYSDAADYGQRLEKALSEAQRELNGQASS